MEERILDSIKSMLGIDELCDEFDNDIIISINSAFSELTQIGVGPDESFEIKGHELWSDFISSAKLNMVKEFVYNRTKLNFDPPSNSFLVNTIEKRLDVLAWRLNAAGEGKDGIDE